jgi:hypothetical protein
MALIDQIQALPAERQAEFVQTFLARYLEPAFGTPTKAEIDLLVFSLLHQMGLMRPERSHYEIARDLRITPTRVRTLKMQMALRDATQTDTALRERIIDTLSTLRFAKEGSLIQFGIEDPLLRGDIAARLKKLGATADSSFNRELVRIQLDAFVDFMADLLPDERREVVRQALIRAGMTDDSLKGVLIGALTQLGKKAAGAAGEVVAKQAGELAGPAIAALLKSAGEAVTTTWRRIFSLEAEPAPPTLEA